jgi:hypothetical protein
MENVYIVLIVVVGIIVVVWMLRGRLTAVTARGSVPKGEVEMKAEAVPEASNKGDATPKYGVDIHGIKSVGDTRIGVQRDDVRLADSAFAGKTDIHVKNDDKKTRK